MGRGEGRVLEPLPSQPGCGEAGWGLTCVPGPNGRGAPGPGDTCPHLTQSPLLSDWGTQVPSHL